MCDTYNHTLTVDEATKGEEAICPTGAVIPLSLPSARPTERASPFLAQGSCSHPTKTTRVLLGLVAKGVLWRDLIIVA